MNDDAVIIASIMGPIVLGLILFFAREEWKYRKALEDIKPLSKEEKEEIIAKRKNVFWLPNLIRAIAKQGEAWKEYSFLRKNNLPVPTELLNQIAVDFEAAEKLIYELLEKAQTRPPRLMTGTEEIENEYVDMIGV